MTPPSSEGVTSVADLAAKVGAIGTDYKDKENELFRYVAYHVIGGSYSVFDFNNFSGGATTSVSENTLSTWTPLTYLDSCTKPLS